MWLSIAIGVMVSTLPIDKIVSMAKELRQQNLCSEALRLLSEASEQHPKSGELSYQTAWTYDKLGDEEKAIPHYEEAIQKGLANEDDLKGCLIGLGSSYRCVGLLTQSQKLFARSRKRFPSCPALQIFEAFTLADLGKKNAWAAPQGLERLFKGLGKV